MLGSKDRSFSRSPPPPSLFAAVSSLSDGAVPRSTHPPEAGTEEGENALQADLSEWVISNNRFLQPSQAMAFASAADPGVSTPMAGKCTRAMRLAILLQAWFRLWLSMAVFALTVGVFLVFLLVRLSGVPGTAFPVSVVVSPLLLALAGLALASILVRPGPGGVGFSPAFQSGGSTLSVTKGPLISLLLVTSLLVVLKLDAGEGYRSGQLSRAIAWPLEQSWAMILIPFWVAAGLLEVVYLRCLWEDRFGTSCAACGWLCSSLPCWQNCACTSQGEPLLRRHRQDQRSCKCLSRRAHLTQGQRNGAAALSAGIPCLVLAIIGCSMRKGVHPRANWAVPGSLLVGAAGEALIGAGMWILAREHARSVVRGVCLEPVQPLPLVHSESDGGWIARVPEPPMATVFLLGQVALVSRGRAKVEAE